MTRQPFNTGWSYRQPVGPFAVQAADAAPTPVTLPHDALRDAVRAADVPSRGAGAYYPAGAFTYLATLDVPAEWAERVVSAGVPGRVPARDGVRQRRVRREPRRRLRAVLRRTSSRSSARRAQRGPGRGPLRAGLPLVLRLRPLPPGVPRTSTTPVHIAPDGVRVTTMRPRRGQAVVEVATTVVNDGLDRDRHVEHHRPRRDRRPRSTRSGRRSPSRPARPAVVRQRLYLDDPALWSADHPSLYTVATRLWHDRATTSTTTVRRPHDPGRPRAGPADQRRAGPATRRLHPSRQRAARCGGRSAGPRSGGSSCSRRPGSTRSAAAHNPLSVGDARRL